MNFSTLDLNLLRVFDAMMVAHNTTRAGKLVGLSQPAVSSALNRLRHLVRDPLFIRQGNLMVPTARAEAMREPVRQALQSVERALRESPDFNPGRERRTYAIHGSDFYAEIVMPELMERLAREAPGVAVQLDHLGDELMLQLLAARKFDFAINDDVECPDWVCRAPAFATSFVAIASACNSDSRLAAIPAGHQLPPDLFAAMPHARYTTCNKMHGALDRYLATLGLDREVRASAKEFHSAARIVAQTNLIGILPRPFAEALSQRLRLRTYELPLHMPSIPLYLYWHAAHDNDPAHAWFRRILLEILAPLDEARASLAGRNNLGIERRAG